MSLRSAGFMVREIIRVRPREGPEQGPKLVTRNSTMYEFRTATFVLQQPLGLHLGYRRLERLHRAVDVLLGMHARGEAAAAAHQVDAMVQHTPLQGQHQRPGRARRK